MIRTLFFAALLGLTGCDPVDKTATISPRPDVQISDTQLSVTRDSNTGDYKIAWTSRKDVNPAMIFAQREPGFELKGKDPIAVGVSSPFVWTPDDASTLYYFTIYPTYSEAAQASIEPGKMNAGKVITPLEGVWRKPCGPIEPLYDGGYYDIVEMVFSERTVTNRIQVFVDSACREPFDQAPLAVSKGNFKLGDTIMTADGDATTSFDLKVIESDGANFDKTEYTIFAIVGDTLVLGDDAGAKDGRTPRRRPNTLEKRRVYERQ